MDAIRGQEEERGKIPSFDTVKFKDIDKYLKAAQKEGKFVFIADMTKATMHQFMTYTAEYETFEFGTEVKKCIIQKTQKFEDASENTRRALVMHMRTGAQMIFHMETMVPDIPKYDNKILPLKDIIFKREKLLTDYKTLVKDSENFDLGNHKGQYTLHSDFNLGVLMDMSDPDTDDEILQMLLDVIPNIEEFKKVYVVPEEGA